MLADDVIGTMDNWCLTDRRETTVDSPAGPLAHYQLWLRPSPFIDHKPARSLRLRYVPDVLILLFGIIRDGYFLHLIIWHYITE